MALILCQILQPVSVGDLIFTGVLVFFSAKAFHVVFDVFGFRDFIAEKAFASDFTEIDLIEKVKKLHNECVDEIQNHRFNRRN